MNAYELPEMGPVVSRLGALTSDPSNFSFKNDLKLDLKTNRVSHESHDLSFGLLSDSSLNEGE